MKKILVSKIILVASLIVLSFTFAACAKNDEAKMAAAAQEVEKKPETQTATAKTQEVKQEEKEKLMALDFSLQMTDGSTFTLLENTDKPILVNYWATWCPPCVREFPDLQEMYETYKEKMHFVAVNSAETKDVIEAFMKKNKYTIPVPMDSDNRVGIMYGISSIPTTFIVDTDGAIVFAQLGMMTKAQMKQAIEKALAN